MTYTEICDMIRRKHETYDVPKLPEPNPDDFIVWGEGEFEKVYKNYCDTYEKQYPAVQSERVPDEGLLDNNDAR
jgi:hypothetical protein